MSIKKEVQIKIIDYPKTQTKQVGLDLEAYNIISNFKNQLINKYKGTRNITFSDAIREMLDKIKRQMTLNEYSEKDITQLKGGKKKR